MREPFTPNTNCGVCFKPLNERDLMILEESETFVQSWCEICMLKHAESYPFTELKRDVYYELQRTDRKIRKPKLEEDSEALYGLFKEFIKKHKKD